MEKISKTIASQARLHYVYNRYVFFANKYSQRPTMTNHDFPIITLTPEAATQYGLGCLKNPKHPGFGAKLNWYREMTAKGLTIKLALDDDKSVGFIEYVPGEHTWRTVAAEGYMVIHCVWVYPKVYQKQGIGAGLVRACMDDAREQELSGVAVVTSEGPWIAGKSLFLPLGFEPVDSRDRFELLVHKFKDGRNPEFIRDADRDYTGLHVLISDQCPYTHKFINDIQGYCAETGLEYTLSKIGTAEQAQHMPSAFGTFAIVYNNKVVADHPVSLTRFKNIVHKELQL